MTSHQIFNNKCIKYRYLLPNWCTCCGEKSCYNIHEKYCIRKHRRELCQIKQELRQDIKKLFFTLCQFSKFLLAETYIFYRALFNAYSSYSKRPVKLICKYRCGQYLCKVKSVGFVELLKEEMSRENASVPRKCPCYDGKSLCCYLRQLIKRIIEDLIKILKQISYLREKSSTKKDNGIKSKDEPKCCPNTKFHFYNNKEKNVSSDYKCKEECCKSVKNEKKKSKSSKKNSNNNIVSGCYQTGISYDNICKRNHDQNLSSEGMKSRIVSNEMKDNSYVSVVTIWSDSIKSWMEKTLQISSLMGCSPSSNSTMHFMNEDGKSYISSEPNSYCCQCQCCPSITVDVGV